ncbi:MAG: DUF6485 family protein [Candidatus Gastranaerophilales bacterium]|nr:DUF6485 family protein [Candidatus Gastranaerophilales bacterium]
MALECNILKNKNNCTCTYTSCSKRGHCCECIAYHRGNNELPGCLFSPEAEKTYDRSVANFIKTMQ